jgi:hypothetical protein
MQYLAVEINISRSFCFQVGGLVFGQPELFIAFGQNIPTHRG